MISSANYLGQCGNFNHALNGINCNVYYYGVWSLKKARLRCDRLCWWPLNFNTLHNYTCIKIDKVILPKSDETSQNFGPPSKPGHGRGSAPYEPSDSTSRPWGGASWTVEKQRASCKSLSRSGSLGFDALWNISLIAARNFSACSRSYLNFVSTPTKPTIYSKAKARRHNIKEQRAERLRTKGSFLWRHAAAATSLVFPPESTEKPNHPRGSEDKDQSNAFEGNETTSSLLIQQQASTSN